MWELNSHDLRPLQLCCRGGSINSACPLPPLPQDWQQTVKGLEAELSERQRLLSDTEAMKQQLLKEVNSLRRERGMSVFELNSVSSKVDDLSRTSQQGRLAEQDLQQLLQLLDTAVKEGTLEVGGCGCGCGCDRCGQCCAVQRRVMT